MIGSIAVIGDSSSVGFATRGRSYPVVLSEMLGAPRPHVAAEFGKTTRIALEQDCDPVVAKCPDLVVVQTGMADSLLHPGERLQKVLEHFVPPSWHGVDGLERRAVYMGSRRLRARQKVVATAKTQIKRLIVASTGGYTRMQPAEYETCLDLLLTRLESTGAIVVCLGLTCGDERFFPRQGRTLRPFSAAWETVMARHPDVVAVDLEGALDRWDDYLADHGHWNASGHAHVAERIVECLVRAHPELRPVPRLPGEPRSRYGGHPQPIPGAGTSYEPDAGGPVDVAGTPVRSL